MSGVSAKPSNMVRGAKAYMLPIITVHPNAAALLVSFATLIAVQLVPIGWVIG